MALTPGTSGSPSLLTDGARLNDGSVSAPSLSFINSTTTGLFRGGSNIISFTTNSTLAGSIDASQVWTLGTTAAAFPGNIIYGKKDGVTIGTGVVGEILSSSGQTNTTFASNAGNLSRANVTLTPGVWLVYAVFAFGAGASASGTGYVLLSLSTTSGGSDANAVFAQIYYAGIVNTFGHVLPPMIRYINVSANTTMHLNASNNFGTLPNGTISGDTVIRAVRIA